MDKEREIEEIAKTVNNGCRVACSDCRERALCEVRHVAEVLVDAGYRKADEVRKETARKFKQTMKDIFRFVLRNKGNTSIPYFNAEELVFAKFDKEVDREFLQEYGVEVDE